MVNKLILLNTKETFGCNENVIMKYYITARSYVGEKVIIFLENYD